MPSGDCIPLACQLSSRERRCRAAISRDAIRRILLKKASAEASARAPYPWAHVVALIEGRARANTSRANT
jgi:hypothetical protein